MPSTWPAYLEYCKAASLPAEPAKRSRYWPTVPAAHVSAMPIGERKTVRKPTATRGGWLDGAVDIYMPDFKFWKPETAQELANAADYPDVARAAIKEMHRQVGDLILDEHGLAREVSPDTFVNVMPQYRPEGLASRYPALARPLAPREFRQAVDVAREEGLRVARD